LEKQRQFNGLEVDKLWITGAAGDVTEPSQD
jgi:hypothetical protein